MASPFIGEIKMFAGNFAPRSYVYCNGSLLSIDQNTALFALIGTTYGGNGQTTFAVPDLRGRVPIHQGTGSGLSTRTLGEASGAETVTLTAAQIPVHNHALAATTNQGTAPSPSAQVVLARPVDSLSRPVLYTVPGAQTINQQAMASTAINAAGGSQPHSNMMPTQAINFIIAVEGIFPSRP
jgi:microcystin-dependent protein